MRTISDFIYDDNSGKANITVNTQIYCLEAIYASTYQFTDNYHILLTPDNKESVTIIFEAKSKPKNISEDLKEFANCLIDHQVRLQLNQTNGKIRDLIVAHAFSHLDLDTETKNI